MTDAEQFETFMKNYQDMVFSTAMRLVANEAEAKDISQEVFLKAYDRFDDLKDNRSAGGWLKTVATNMSLNHLSRYRARWRFFSEITATDSGEEKELEFEASENTIEAVSTHDDRMAVEAALGSLPAAQRVPLVLYHMEGFRYEEIAAKLGISLGKVKTDILRGREALRRKLQLKFGDELNP
jgi:RNA polymerase sigma-70 factor (ECF subfamily)